MKAILAAALLAASLAGQASTSFTVVPRTGPYEGPCGPMPGYQPADPAMSVPKTYGGNPFRWKVATSHMPNPQQLADYPSAVLITFGGALLPDGLGAMLNGLLRNGASECAITVLPECSVPFAMPFVEGGVGVPHEILNGPVPMVPGLSFHCQWVGIYTDFGGVPRLVTSEVLHVVIV